MTRRLTLVALVAVTAASSCSLHRMIDEKVHGANPYQKRLFYSRYLNPGDPLDQRIQRDLDQLRNNPRAASVHNDLGQALLQKNFPNDARLEFQRATDDDRSFYPAWYNLGLLEASVGNDIAAGHAFRQTVRHRPGHAAALFQIGLIEEKNRHFEAALDHYVKAFSINHKLLDVRVNPRIVDSQLVPRALLRLYPSAHARGSLAFQGAPADYSDAVVTDGASPQAAAENIVSPTTPVTSPAVQPIVPTPGGPSAQPPTPNGMQPIQPVPGTTPPANNGSATGAAVSVPRDTSAAREKDPLPPPNPDAWKAWQEKQKKKSN